ncbi:NACHT domain-containing protein [Streptomyces sp. NPDC096080]|uniref:NACHT domain-containing protein n=1 Tax=Streptomyces sp. NPDC096080 TaxID=3156693 RepID=UPI003316B88B
MAFAGWNIVRDGKNDSADTATLLGVPIGVIGLVIAVVALRKPFEGNDAELARGRAGTLALQVKNSESVVRRQLLGADTQRINLTYVLHSVTERAATAPPAGRTFSNGPAVLPDVLDYYRSIRPRRLIITGAAGAGKTVLALELMLALIEGRAEDDLVPVRIPLAQWDTQQPLTTLLTQRLTEAYDWPSGMAAELVDNGLVLPVLDGLDEMDPSRADGTPDPEAPRARAALEALNEYQDGRDAGPLVLTCRTAHYDAFAPASRLIDAARVTIDPVGTHHAIAYLRARALDTPRWQPLIDHLHAHPHSPLATILSTPWRLCLTVTVYQRNGNPAELLDHPTGHDLDQYLLARYLPAAIANTPNPRHYQFEDVRRWLCHLTGHLNGVTTGIPASDIALHRLWTLAGTTRVRAADILLTSFLIALPISTFTLLSGPALEKYYGIGTLLPLVAFGGILAFRLTPKPSRLRFAFESALRRFLVRFWTAFAIWFTMVFSLGLIIAVLCAPPIAPLIAVAAIFGLFTGVASGFMGGLAGGFKTGFRAWFKAGFAIGGALIFLYITPFVFDPYVRLPDLILALYYGGLLGGSVIGSIGGLARGLRGEPTAVASPQAIIRDDIIYGLAIGPISGITFTILGAITLLPHAAGLLDWELPYTFSTICFIGLLVLLLTGIANGLAAAARRYAVFLVYSRGKLPFRLAPFLNWAVTAGLLRYSGPAYQFRHRELEQWLAQLPRP